MPARLPGARRAFTHAVEPGEAVSRYSVARDTVRERAERYEAVLSFAKARLARAENETLGQVERRWLRNFRRTHPGMKVSIRSVKEWTEMFRTGDSRIDALLDGNDGAKQRGARIPAAAKQMFKDQYLRAHKPNIQLIYDNVLAVAKVKDWGEMPSYDTFWRFAKSLPKMVRRLLRAVLGRDHGEAFPIVSAMWRRARLPTFHVAAPALVADR